MRNICSIENCGRYVNGYGLCESHNRRRRRHGDPLGGAVGPGEAQRYYREVVLAYDGEDCLIWRHSRDRYGYGRLQHEGRQQVVSRLLCEEQNGPPPTPKHEAAHLCGNGHEGCCNKRHLTWKTHAENMADMVLHGRSLNGRSANPKRERAA